MKSWKSTLGGALSATGTFLVGIGVVPQLSGSSSTMLTYIALVGFFLQAAGTFFGHLFSADKSAVESVLRAQQATNVQIAAAQNAVVESVASQVVANTQAIAQKQDKANTPLPPGS
jgi:hypothetical protein